jgi:hypothetical protein
MKDLRSLVAKGLESTAKALSTHPEEKLKNGIVAGSSRSQMRRERIPVAMERK